MKAMVPLIRYVRPVRPIDFPSSDPEWDMGQSGPHERLCDVLYSILRAALEPDSLVAKDQFVYFDASDNTKKCAPDVFVKLGSPFRLVDVWHTWKDGAPDLCVEIVSPSDRGPTFDDKLHRYHVMGASELVAFDPGARPGARMRAWDRVDGDLVERVVDDERTPCVTLGLWFVLAPTPDEPGLPVTLRLARDPLGADPLPTLAERERAEKEALRAEKERERAEKERACADKEAAIAEKEAALAELANLKKRLEGG